MNTYTDVNGNDTNQEVPLACASQINDDYYVKQDDGGFLYDPFGLYVNANDLVRVDPYKSKKIFDWTKTNETVYKFYVQFLKTKSRGSFQSAQTTLNNSQRVQQEKIFRRSSR